VFVVLLCKTTNDSISILVTVQIIFPTNVSGKCYIHFAINNIYSWGDIGLLNSKALTKIQTIFLITIIIVGVAVVGLVYSLWSGSEQTGEVIKIGLCADLDMPLGKAAWQGLVLAAEHINAEGGVLGKQIEIIGEDSDSEGDFSPSVVVAACTRLITYHKVDFLIGAGAEGYLLDTVADHEKIMLGTAGGGISSTQRVVDDYDRYKYFFRITRNQTIADQSAIEGLLFLRQNFGFNKIARLATNYGSAGESMYNQLRIDLENNGFEFVYDGRFIPGTFDFGSYFAAAEAAGAEIMVSAIMTQEGIPFIKEWYDRQSPILLCGTNYLGSALVQSWEWTEGKCETVIGAPSIGYPITRKSLAFEDTYLKRWGTFPTPPAFIQYDALRYILFDALQRAGTTETEAVIDALETTSIETTFIDIFRFTSSHDSMYEPDWKPIIFQWQAEGKRVPIFPPEVMEEAGATYTNPPWSGPWDEQ